MASPSDAKSMDSRIPDEQLISRVEREVVMPKGAGPLSSYDRSYTQVKMDRKDYVLGQMIDHRLTQMFAATGSFPVPPPVRRVLVDEIDLIFDGGCGIINLMYEVGSAAPPKVACNPQGPTGRH
jgi:hypothetical protein